MSMCRTHKFKCTFYCKTCQIQVCGSCLCNHNLHDIKSIKIKYQEAQHVKTCGICENPVRFYCSVCELGICEDCVASHLRVSQRHNVTEYSRKGLYDTVQTFCETHKKSKCTFYCKTCAIPFCGNCIQDHKKHENISLADLTNESIDMLMWKVHNLKTFIKPKYENLYTPCEHMSALKHRIIKHGENMHKKINDSVSDMVRTITTIQKLHFKQLGFLQRRLKATDRLIKKYEDLLKDPVVLQNPFLLPNLDEYDIVDNVPEIYDFSLLSFKPSDFVDSPIIVGSLRNAALSRKPAYSIVPRIADHQLIDFVTDCGTNVNDVRTHIEDLWMCSGYTKEIKQIDSDGNILNAIRTQNIPKYILKSQPEEFLYSDETYDCIWKICYGREAPFIEFRGWTARGMALSTSKEILVALYSYSKNSGKIERYSRNGSILQTMEYNTKGQILFQSPMFVTQNYDENICVSDYENKSVIVVNKFCHQQFRYKGSPDLEQPFGPTGIAVDQQCHILVSDKNNDVIHLLNRNGKLARYLMCEQLFKPGPLFLDSKERLCIGNQNGIISVLKYLTG